MSNNHEKMKYIVDYDDPNNRGVRHHEMERIASQGTILTNELQPLPDTFNRFDGQVADFACGGGELILKLGAEYPKMRAIGVDDFPEIVDYANAQADVRRLGNVEFYRGDISQPIKFADDSFDLVTARCIEGIISRAYWPVWAAECYRLCKDGGMVQFLEPETMCIAGSPLYDEMYGTFLREMYNAQKTFSSIQIAITPMLDKFASDAGFVDVKKQIDIIDFIPNTPVHKAIVRDVLGAVISMKKFFRKNETEFTHFYAQLEQELSTARGSWLFTRVTGIARK